jgi:hypothetical protein
MSSPGVKSSGNAPLNATATVPLRDRFSRRPSFAKMSAQRTGWCAASTALNSSSAASVSATTTTLRSASASAATSRLTPRSRAA